MVIIAPLTFLRHSDNQAERQLLLSAGGAASRAEAVAERGITQRASRSSRSTVGDVAAAAAAAVPLKLPNLEVVPPDTTRATTATPTTAPPTTAATARATTATTRPTPATSPPTTRRPAPTTTRPAPPPRAVAADEPSGNTQSGKATWYDAEYHADDPDACAHRTLPKGTIVTVTAVRTGETTTCRVADRGPFVDGYIIDLSKATFSRLAPPEDGVLNVQISW